MAKKKRRRSPVPNQVALRGADGSAYDHHGAFVYHGREKARAVVVPPLDFPYCPICFSGDDLTDEHVPMEALGGTVATKTCKSCNNVLGSVAEEELRRVFHAEVTVRVEAPGSTTVRGPRTASAYLRRTPGRDPAFFIENAHQEFADVLAVPGPKVIDYPLRDPFLAEVALIKYSYLAACLWLQVCPRSRSADAVRAVLIAARNQGAAKAAALMDHVERVWPFVRIENNEPIAPIALLEPTATHPNWMFVLGGALAVQWPFTDIHPNDKGRVAAIDPQPTAPLRRQPIGAVDFPKRGDCGVT